MSTRSLAGCYVADDSSPPDVWRFEPGDAWSRSNHAEFQAHEDPQTPTIIWVHGNRMNAHDARATGRAFVDRLRRHAPPDMRFRFVIWSWPSERSYRRNLVDLRVNADRGEQEAFYVADFVGRIAPNAPVSLIGYSFGTRSVAGAMHLLAGGTIGGHGMTSPPTPRAGKVRAVLMAAAFHNYWLAPDGRYGRALEAGERLLVLKNPADFTLKWYPILAHGRVRQGPQALGYTGVRGLAAGSANLVQINVSGWLGREHDLSGYLPVGAIFARMGPFAFFDRQPQQSTPAP